MFTPVRLSGFEPDDCVRSLGADVAVYVVGGAVRDELLGIASSDRDWVVTGATPEQMVAAGFTPVGADFPVFLHPKTREEYALARTERKTSAGYRGFVFHASPQVSLQDDLQRRDLTVNAMAMSADGALNDPWGGYADLQARVFRHVSPAFAEDPVRILRLARFAARFADFSVHPQTLDFCADMVKRGEAKALVAERVWQEVSRLLMSAAPAHGWSVLVACGALPDIAGAQATAALVRLEPLQMLGEPFSKPWGLAQRWAAWMLNAAWVPGLSGVSSDLAARWKVPADCAELAQLCVGQFQSWISANNAAALAAFFATADLYRRPERFTQAIEVMHAVAAAQADPLQPALPPALWLKVAGVVRALPVGSVAKEAAAKGMNVPDAVAHARQALIAQVLAESRAG